MYSLAKVTGSISDGKSKKKRPFSKSIEEKKVDLKVILIFLQVPDRNFTTYVGNNRCWVICSTVSRRSSTVSQNLKFMNS